MPTPSGEPWRIKLTATEIQIATPSGVIATVYDDEHEENGLANAYLLASAPRLLRSLEALAEAARNPRGNVCLLCGWAVGHDVNAPCGDMLQAIDAAKGEA